MKPFFRPEDFENEWKTGDHISQENASKVANAKLEREGTKVYTICHPLDDEKYNLATQWINNQFENHGYKALLINIQPIEKCEHPRGGEVTEEETKEALRECHEMLSSYYESKYNIASFGLKIMFFSIPITAIFILIVIIGLSK